MDLYDNIIYLAQVNSRKCYPKRLEDINTTIPYFKIEKSQIGKYIMKSYNYEFHDNAPRMSLYEQYFTEDIFPFIDKDINISGYYNIELHDSYTYLNNNKNYENVLCFSKFKNDSDPILIVDPYFVCNWGNMLNQINDTINWNDKINKIVFAGTTTGNRDPLLNERIDICQWGLKNKDICDFNITKIAQIDINDINKKIPNFNEFYTNNISIDEQYKYKYQLNIDGNTCKFNVEQFKMNSIVMKYQSLEMLWYHPLFQNNIHYLDINKILMREKINYYNNNEKEAQIIINNANKLSNELFTSQNAKLYMINLFETIWINK